MKKSEFLEYAKGKKIFGSSYLQRLGSPGNYIYIYPSAKMKNITRKYKTAYTRLVKKSKRFLKRIGTRYEATSINLRPKTWHKSIITIKTKNGGTLNLKYNLKKHGVKSYRSVDMGTGGMSSQLAKSKRKGVLRYR